MPDRLHFVRLGCLAVCFAVVAGCARDRGAAPPPAAEPAPITAPVPPPPAPPPAAASLTEAEVRAALERVRNLLDFGQTDAAQGELNRVLGSDPSNRTAISFNHQMHDDPAALYGKDSFPYRVMPGDTVATIAQRFMNDRDQFYGLSRFNGISVPGQLQAGILIKVPGKAPLAKALPPVQPPSPAPPQAPVQPSAPPPPAPAPPPPPAPLAQPAVPTESPAAAIDRYTRAARTAMASQDVCGAIANWKKVLELDPANASAPLELQKAQDLRKKLGHC